nr:unnamed protein product [Digitaria exilis]
MQPPPAHHRFKNPSAGRNQARKRLHKKSHGGERDLTLKGEAEEEEEVDGDGPGAHATAAAAAAVCIIGEEKALFVSSRAVLGWRLESGDRGRFGVGGIVELCSLWACG